jgi:hypothetical protein
MGMADLPESNGGEGLALELVNGTLFIRCRENRPAANRTERQDFASRGGLGSRLKRLVDFTTNRQHRIVQYASSIAA